MFLAYRRHAALMCWWWLQSTGCLKLFPWVLLLWCQLSFIHSLEYSSPARWASEVLGLRFSTFSEKPGVNLKLTGIGEHSSENKPPRNHSQTCISQSLSKMWDSLSFMFFFCCFYQTCALIWLLALSANVLSRTGRLIKITHLNRQFSVTTNVGVIKTSVGGYQTGNAGSNFSI